MKRKNKKAETEISATPVLTQPETVFELINKYGTYEIQPTADSGNDYPHIAQGFPRDAGPEEKDQR